MKKKILSITAGLVLAVLSSATFAQSATKKPTQNVPTEKALSAFDKQFGNAITPSIQTTNNGILLLQGKTDSRTITSVFNRRGNWVYSIVRYPSTNPDKHIAGIVQRGYAGRAYDITGMEKVDQPGMETVFIVYLKNSSSYKILRVSQNNIEVMKDYKNA